MPVRIAIRTAVRTARRDGCLSRQRGIKAMEFSSRCRAFSRPTCRMTSLRIAGNRAVASHSVRSPNPTRQPFWSAGACSHFTRPDPRGDRLRSGAIERRQATALQKARGGCGGDEKWPGRRAVAAVLPLVPKLYLGTHVLAKFYFALRPPGSTRWRCHAGRVRSATSRAMAFPSTTWERGKDYRRGGRELCAVGPGVPDRPRRACPHHDYLQDIHSEKLCQCARARLPNRNSSR